MAENNPHVPSWVEPMMDEKYQVNGPAWMEQLAEEAWKEANKIIDDRKVFSGLDKYQDDPYGFCTQMLGESYTEDVNDVMESVRDNRVTIARSANAVGKSYAAARIAAWWFKVFPDSKVYMTAAPPLENLRKILWGHLMHVVSSQPVLFSNFPRRGMTISRHDQSFITAVAIPTSGTSAEREAKFCADADDLFELYDGSLVRYGDLIGRNDIPVVSVNGQFQRKWSTAEFFDNGEKMVFEIQLEDGQVVRRTGNHPLYVGWDIGVDHHTHDGKHKKGCIRIKQEGWLEVGDLREGFALLCPDDTSFNFGSEEADENLVKFLAYMIGDGCFIGKSDESNRLQFTQEDNPQLAEFLDTLDQLGVNYTRSDRDEYNWVNISTHDKRLSEFVRDCGLHGKGSEHKFVPKLIFSLRKDQVALFLSRLFSTDGWACVTNKAEIGYASKSEQLVRDIQRLLNRFGVQSRVINKTIEPYGMFWSLYINHSTDIQRFSEQIGIYGKEQAVMDCLDYAENRACIYGEYKFEKNGYRWKKIREIRVIGERPTVGVHVPGNNTYLTSIVEHNSGKHAPHLLFIVDEGDAVPDEVYKGIESCMSGEHDRLLIMFNPRASQGPVWSKEINHLANVVELSAFRHPNVITGKNVYPGAVTREVTVRRINEWTRPLNSHEQPDQECFELPPFLLGTTATSESGNVYQPLTNDVRKITNPAFSYMVLGKYPAQSITQLINEAWIVDAVHRWQEYVERNGTRAPGIRPIMGVDVAELGADNNVACFRYGSFVDKFILWRGMDPEQTANYSLDLMLQRNAEICMVDGTGVGSSVAPTMARHARYNGNDIRAVSVKAAGKPSAMIKTEIGEFRQIRDQLWWALREWLRTDPNAMIPNDRMLIEELKSVNYEPKDNGKIEITPKSTLRELLRRSPDRADALCLTFTPMQRAKIIRLG